MARYLIARLASLVFVLFAVSVIAFLLMHSVPGGPFDERERRLPEATRQAQLRKYGLDKPLWEQYLRYMWHAARFDFGVPFQSPTETVAGLIKRAWPVTIRIGILTILLSYSLGVLLGCVAAMKQNSWLDYAVTLGATMGLTVPNFVVAIWLILLLSVRFQWLPTGGWGEPRHYIMPVIAYSLAPMALVARYTRVSLLEVLRADYVRTARAKGLAERRVVGVHALRNSLIPVVTLIALDLGFLLGGSVITETIFAWPGVGWLTVQAIFARDLPLVQTAVTVLATIFVLINLAVDLLYAVVDPRIRHA